MCDTINYADRYYCWSYLFTLWWLLRVCVTCYAMHSAMSVLLVDVFAK